MTNSAGYTLTYAYDNLNRLTSVSYPDGTSEQTVYDRLDAIMHSDRLGRWTQSSYDVMDQLACQTDPLGRQTKYCWCTCGGLASLTDPAGHTTSWQRDLEGRVFGKTYADGTSISYLYDSLSGGRMGGSGQLLSRTDALTQVTNYA